MLDRVGLRLLATALSGRGRRTSLRYAAQKLPVEAARWLRLMAATGDTSEGAGAPSGEAAEVRRVVAGEAEEVAAGMKRRPPRAPSTRHARRAETLGAAADATAPKAPPTTTGTDS
jgi:hypothetical protein